MAKTARHITGIGRKIFVNGKRGKWDVTILISLSDQQQQECQVRFHPLAEFKPFSLRDDARFNRDGVQNTLAAGGTVYVNVFDAGQALDGERRFPNKCWVVVPVTASDFEGAWKPTKSCELYSLKQVA